MLEIFILLSLIGTGLYFNKDEVHKLQSTNKENINQTQRNMYQSHNLKNAVTSHNIAATNRFNDSTNGNKTILYNRSNKEDFTRRKPMRGIDLSSVASKNGFGGSSQYNKSGVVYSQLLGKEMLQEEFTKNDQGINNMVPFIKKTGMSINSSDKLFQRKLETMSGNDPFYKKKKEVKELFKPTMGYTNINGQQLDTKYLLNKDRYAIGKNRNNELPFEQEYIQPFEGYNNEYLRDLVEVDAKTKLNSSAKYLRGESNVSYEGREGPPSAINSKPGVLGEVMKNRPDKFSTLEVRPLMETNGMPKPMKHPDCTIIPQTKRGQFTNYFGDAKSTYEKEPERPLIRKSGKVTYKKDSVRNITAADMWNASRDPFDYDKNSYFLPANEREAYQGKTQLLNVDSAFKAIIAPFSDIAKTTVKETNIHNEREGNYNGPTKLTVQPTDVLKTTIKETNIHNDREGNVYSYNPKPTAFNPNDVAKTTIKETNIDNDREGNVGTLESIGKGYLTNPQYAPRTNKETTSDIDYYGTAGSYDDRPTSYAADYNMRQNTMKEPLEVGRDPTPQGVKIANGSSSINLDINKLDSDYINIREVAQTKIYPSIPTEVPCQVTNEKIPLDNNKIANRIGGNLLEAFKKNPYTQPLDSFAYH